MAKKVSRFEQQVAEIRESMDILWFHNICMPLFIEPKYRGEPLPVPEFHRRIYCESLCGSHRFQLVVAPRGFSKSTLARIFSVWEALQRRDKFILYVSSTHSKVLDHMGSIIKMLKYPVLQLIFGFKVLRCSLSEIECQFLDNGERFKFQAIMSGKEITGKNYEAIRPTLIMIDDLEDFAQANSLDRTNKLEDWLLNILIECLPSSSEGRIRMINTVLSRESLTNRILGKTTIKGSGVDFSNWSKAFYQALDHNDRSIWEARHPTESLHEKRRTNPSGFAQNYMNEPLDLSQSRIKGEYLQYFNQEEIDEAQFKNIYIHVDTTHTGKTNSDYSAIVAVSQNEANKCFYVLDFVLEKLETVDLVKRLIGVYARWERKVRKITFDEIGHQSFGTWARKVASEEYNLSLPLEELKCRKDKVQHLEAHIPHFIARRIFFPREHPQIDIAITQLLSFPAKNVNDDFVDGLAGCMDNFLKPDNLKALLAFRSPKLLKN